MGGLWRERGWGGSGPLLTFSTFRMGAYSRLGAYSNKYGIYLHVDQYMPQLFHFLLLSLRGDQYIPQLFHFILCYTCKMTYTYQSFSTSSHVISSCQPIRTYRNFSTSSFVITSWWSIHDATFPLSPMLYHDVDEYIPKLYNFLLCYNFTIITTYHNIFTFSISILCYNFVMINIYRNFSTLSLLWLH